MISTAPAMALPMRMPPGRFGRAAASRSPKTGVDARDTRSGMTGAAMCSTGSATAAGCGSGGVSIGGCGGGAGGAGRGGGGGGSSGAGASGGGAGGVGWGGGAGAGGGVTGREAGGGVVLGTWGRNVGGTLGVVGGVDAGVWLPAWNA